MLWAVDIIWENLYTFYSVECNPLKNGENFWENASISVYFDIHCFCWNKPSFLVFGMLVLIFAIF